MFSTIQMRRLMMAVGLGLFTGAGAELLAAPQGAQVVSGSASITRTGNLTQINAGNNAIINYQSFNIGAAETVRFVQPTAQSRVLNRVLSADPSYIYGSLQANGIVYLINPAGVIFGQGSVVNVGGLYAGAGNLSNENFLAGNNHFTDVNGSVINHGTISGDMVALIGKHVANYGSIISDGGTVTMLAGDDVIVGDRDHHFVVRLSGAAGQVADAPGIENTGKIDAGKGKVIWGAGDMYALAMNNSGEIKAASVSAESAAGVSEFKGKIDASNASGKGGDVTISGGDIALYGAIDASGSTGGGTVLIGGEQQGGGTLAHAHAVWIGPDAQVIANATGSGNGGTIIVYSDAATRIYGLLEALGAGSGHGGFVETSGGWLDLHTIPVVGNGQWLIDPFNLTLSNGATTGVSSSAATFTATADDAVVNISDVVTALTNGTTVTLSTGSSGSQAGTFTLANDFDFNGIGANKTLNINAYGNIVLNGKFYDSDNTGDTLHLSLSSANGSISTSLGSTVISTPGNVSLLAPNGSVGTVANPIILARTPNITIDVSGNIYLQHDGATDVSSLTLSVDPNGSKTYSLTNFASDEFNLVATSNALVINKMVTSSSGTTYSVTAKTGDIYIDDNSTAIAGIGFNGGNVGDGGIFSGTGNITVVASQGSILPEIARADFEVRTSLVSYTGGSYGDPIVTLKANRSIGSTDSLGEIDIQNASRLVFEARGDLKIGGSGQVVHTLLLTLDPSGPGLGRTPTYAMTGFDQFSFDMASDGTNLVVNRLQSTWHMDFDGDAVSADVQGTGFFLRSRTGNLIVNADPTVDSNPDPAHDISSATIFNWAHNRDTLLTGIYPIPVNVPLDSTGTRHASTYLVADRGNIELSDRSILNELRQVHRVDLPGSPLINVGGVTTLVAYGKIKEYDGTTSPLISTSYDNTNLKLFTDQLFMYADNYVGTGSAIGAVPTLADPKTAVDLQTFHIYAYGGENVVNYIVNQIEPSSGPGDAGNHAGDIAVFDRIGQLHVHHARTWDGVIDVRSMGQITLYDNSVQAGFQQIGSGLTDAVSDTGHSNDVFVLAGGRIRENSANTVAKIQAPGDHVTLIANFINHTTGASPSAVPSYVGNIGGDSIPLGASNDVNYLDIDARYLTAHSGLTGAVLVRAISGDLSITNSTVYAAEDLTPAGQPGYVLYNAIHPTSLGGGVYAFREPGLQTDAAPIDVQTAAGNLRVYGAINTITPNDIYLTALGNSIYFKPSLGSPGDNGIGDNGYPARYQTYTANNTVLEQDMSFRSTNSGDILFRRTLTNTGLAFIFSNEQTPQPLYNLTLTTDANGSIFFRGLIFNIQTLICNTSDNGSTNVYASIFTGGEHNIATQIYNSPVVLHSDVIMQDLSPAPGSGIYFNRTLDSDSTFGGWALTLLTNVTPTDPQRVPLVSFAADVGSLKPLSRLLINARDNNKNYNFGDLGDSIGYRTNVPTVATIVVGSRSTTLTDSDGNALLLPTVDSNITIRVLNDFVMGHNEKLTSLGSLSIYGNVSTTTLADSSIVLSDVNVRGNLLLDGGNRAVAYLSHNTNSPNGILAPTDFVFGDDLGIDIWTKNNFTVANTSGQGQFTFAINDPNLRIFSGGTVTGAPIFATVAGLPDGVYPADYRADNIPGTAGPSGFIVLDLLKGQATGGADVATIFAGPIPFQDRLNVYRARNEHMEEILTNSGINVQNPETLDLVQRLFGNAFYDDYAGISASDRSTLTINRVREQAVMPLLTQYKDLLGDNGNAARNSLGSSYQSYADSKPAAISGAGYRQYLEAHPDAGLATLNQLGTILHMVDQLGLSPAEVDAAKLAIVKQVVPASVDPKLLLEAAQSAPTPVSANQ